MSKLRNKRQILRYSESLKMKIAEEVGTGKLTTKEAMSHYGIKYRKTVDIWVRKYGYRNYETEIVRISMKSEQEHIKELEKALANERLRNLVFAAQLESYEELVPDFKKKLNSKELKKFEKNEKKIKSFR